MNNGIEVKFNTRFKYIPNLPENGDKVSFSGCGIDINGIVRDVKINSDEYSCIVDPIVEFIDA